MNDTPKKRGYALTGLMALGALGCGSGSPDDGADSEVTGFPLPTGTDESGTGAESGTSGSETETGEDTSGETEAPTPGCSYRGTVCGEYLVCQCSCDYSADCCACESTTCTLDAHCGEGEVCNVWVENHYTYSECVPTDCANATPVFLAGAAADPSAFADIRCAAQLEVHDTALLDLADFEDLEHVMRDVFLSHNANLMTLTGLAITQVETLHITHNDGLTDISALTSLEQIRGGVIRCNPKLDPAHVEAVLAQIPGGELIELDSRDDPC